MNDCSTDTPVLTPGIVESVDPDTSTTSGFFVIDQLLRDRKGLLARIDSGEDLAGLARTMILTIIASAFVFGAALGLLRGGTQIAFAAVKLPVVILLTAGLCTPLLCALRHVVVGHSEVRKDLALVLSSLALGSLVIAALAPIIMLAVSRGAGYHGLILLTVGCCVVGGVVGLSFFISGTKELAGGHRLLVVSITLLFVALVGIQMTWTFRPYLVRPRTEDVPLIRELEGSFFESVIVSVPSSFGVYRREFAPLPEADVQQRGELR
jgi:hypothetical protein